MQKRRDFVYTVRNILFGGAVATAAEPLVSLCSKLFAQGPTESSGVPAQDSIQSSGVPIQNLMKIYEGKEIHEVDSPYLSLVTRREIKSLVDYVEQGDHKKVYKGVEDVVATLKNVKFGSPFETLIEQTDKDFPEAYIGKEDEEYMNPMTVAVDEFKEKFELKGIYFSDKGFLGFIFQDRNALVLQIAEPNVEESHKFGRTVPIVKKWDKWVGVNYGRPHYYNGEGYFSVGPLGKQFCSFIDKKLSTN